MLMRSLIFPAVIAISAAHLSCFAASAQEVVIDSKGKTVGTVQGAPDRPWVRLKMKDGTWTASRLGWLNFNTNYAEMPYFVTESSDCTGTKYVWGSLFNYALTFKMKAADTKIYLRYPIPPYKNIIVGSEMYWDQNAGKGVCQPRAVPYSTYVAPFKTIDTSTLGFTPPFTIR